MWKRFMKFTKKSRKIKIKKGLLKFKDTYEVLTTIFHHHNYIGNLS